LIAFLATRLLHQQVSRGLGSSSQKVRIPKEPMEICVGGVIWSSRQVWVQRRKLQECDFGVIFGSQYNPRIILHAHTHTRTHTLKPRGDCGQGQILCSVHSQLTGRGELLPAQFVRLPPGPPPPDEGDFSDSTIASGTCVHARACVRVHIYECLHAFAHTHLAHA